ncbi:hypothetical protein [Roseixanthobacter glucoisosaccharinicivorans]|uniref:hypothetical protein n=1 Tax=Roseixanthobacter glucoisosaccharinicivorans TaxID=3119923 RepID=UPI00372AEA96
MNRMLRLLLAGSALLALTGCESFDFDKINPFQERKTPLSGTRQPVFPNGVPGVTASAPLDQPSNANVSLDAISAAKPNASTAAPGSN